MRLVADLHTHSIASGHGYSTIEEITKAASCKGLKAVAITDHGPAIPGGAHLYHFWNLRVLPRKINGVYVLKGAEVNVVDSKGKIDLDKETMETLDLVHVGFHPRCGYVPEDAYKNTQVLIAAMKNPYIDVVVHPGNPQFPINIEQVVEAAERYNVLLEINNASFTHATSRKGSYENDLNIAKAALERGLEIIIGSDAHISHAVGDFGEAVKVAEEAGFTEDKVFNSSLKRISDFLVEKDKKPLEEV